MQPTQIALGKTQNATDLLKLDYQYGDLQWNGSVDAEKNHGNLAKQTITVPSVGATAGFSAVQNYDYDSLNRIQIASETLTPTSGPAESWVQEFRYDRYGNRTFHEPTTTTLPKECGTAPNLTVCPGVVPIVNPSVNSANNQLNGYSFDDAGNTTRDAENRRFIYDAENKQVKVETLTGETVTGTIGEYWYDGDGKRIKKRGYTNNVLTEETIFLYDAAGKLIGEYSNEVAQSQDAKVAYLTNDHLGSPRVNTDINGNVTSRHDYHPFGEEIDTPFRMADTGYAGEAARQQFTGYERDNETDLDFAQARYYAKNAGRFTSPDEPFAGQDLHDPQTWHLYAYTSNNPVARIDPNGRRWFYRTSGNTLEINWVNPNEDGSFTAPEGDGWIAQNPGDTLELYSAENDTTYYLSELEDGSPYINQIKTNRGVQDVSIETFTMFRIAKGSSSLLGGIYGAARNAFAAYAVRQAEKKLIKELSELSTGELMERVGNSGVNMFRDLFGREFGASGIHGAQATKMARELLEAGFKKIPEGLTREQLLAYRQIAVNAMNKGIDKGAQAERIKTLDYLLSKVKN